MLESMMQRCRSDDNALPYIHLISRRNGDVADPPRGGIRHVIFPAKDSISGAFMRGC
jgi:hypothetical protein